MNRIAVVTGANRGIGREVARQLAMAGDIVYPPHATWRTVTPRSPIWVHRRTCTHISSTSPTQGASTG
jgi:hypothetical protein